MVDFRFSFHEYYDLFLQSTIDEHLSHFQVLVSIITLLQNSCVCLLVNTCISLGIILENGIAQS